MNARLTTTAALLVIISGCTAGNPNRQEPPLPTQPMSFAVHLAYDDARAGCEKLTSKLGETVYVAPAAELTRSDLEVARALHSEKRHMLQLVLNYSGRRALEALTRANYRAAIGGLPGDGKEREPPARLAVLINGQLVGAPYVDRVVGSGEIQIIDVYSWQESEDAAAALNLRGMP